MNVVRRLLEISVRGMVFKKRYSEKFARAPLFVTPEAGLGYLIRPLDKIDPTILEFVDHYVKPGFTVWDVGANLGLFGIAAAVKAGSSGQVIAVEPDTWLSTLLHKSARSQSETTAPIEVISLAVSNAIAMRRFSVARRSRATNHLEGYGSTQTNGVRYTEQVLCVTLDWLGDYLPAPDILKIDVEGAETQALQGGLNLIRQKRPMLLIEVMRDNYQAVSALLTPIGYHFFDAEADLLCQSPGNTPFFNTIALCS